MQQRSRHWCSLLQYIDAKYFPSPAYLRIDGAPVVTNFDIDAVYKIDWTAAKAALASASCHSFFKIAAASRHAVTARQLLVGDAYHDRLRDELSERTFTELE